MLGVALLIYIGPTALRGIRATRDTQVSNVESQEFTPYKFSSTAMIQTPDLHTSYRDELKIYF